MAWELHLLGWRKTTKAQDKTIMKTFKKIRPPGHGVDSRKLHQALPRKLKKTVGRRTLIRRLADEDITPTAKVNKTDPEEALAKRRLGFGKKYEDKTAADWKEYLQGVWDLSDFTYYPKDLMPRFKQVRARWTYMHPSEKYLPAFVRPKRWFKAADWKKVRK